MFSKLRSLFLMLLFSGTIAFGQQIGAIEDQLSYYIDENDDLYWMSSSYKHYDISRGQFRTMDRPIKAPLNEKIAKMVYAGNDEYFVLTKDGNIWKYRFELLGDVDNSKAVVRIIDNSGTNADLLSKNMVVKKDGNVYAIENLMPEEIALYHLLTEKVAIEPTDIFKIKYTINSRISDYTSMNKSSANPDYYSNMINYTIDDLKENKVSTNAMIGIEGKRNVLMEFLKDRYINSPKEPTVEFIQGVFKKYTKTISNPYGIAFTNLGIKKEDYKIGENLMVKTDSTLWYLGLNYSYGILKNLKLNC